MDRRHPGNMDIAGSHPMTNLLWLTLIALVITVGAATQYWINRKK